MVNLSTSSQLALIAGARDLDPMRGLTLGCHTALDTAIITAPEARDPELLKKLDAVAGRVLGRA